MKGASRPFSELFQQRNCYMEETLCMGSYDEVVLSS